ncbi:MAG: restriction endonuclease [Candidatus Acidiferrales bacterium]
MMPKQREMEIPLLKCLEEMGGKAEPSKIYIRMRQFFPSLTESDLTETLTTGGNKWTNRIQWVRQRLVSIGEMASPEHGVWAITEKGRRRLAELAGLGTSPESKSPKESEAMSSSGPVNFEEMAEDYVEAFKEKVIQKLQDLRPDQFERFAGVLLAAYGFVQVKVSGRAGDGGVDGHGSLKVGLSTMNVAFQCKRWQGQVGRPEIDKFRGAIQGEFEQGIFFTTSDFSSQARDASIKKGAVPIVLVNGVAVVQLMIDKQLGVKRRPVETYEDQIETLFEES